MEFSFSDTDLAHVDVTPAMAEAGERALGFPDVYGYSREDIIRVYQTMELVRLVESRAATQNQP